MTKKNNGDIDKKFLDGNLNSQEMKVLIKLDSILKKQKKYSSDGVNITKENMDNLIKDIEFNDETLIHILKQVDPYQVIYFSKIIVDNQNKKKTEIDYVINKSSIARALWGIQTLNINRI